MEIYKLDLPIYEKMVLLFIRDLIAEHGRTAFPSFETIARECSMSLRKAKMVVKQLVGLGLLDKAERFREVNGQRVQQSNEYEISTSKNLADEKSASDAPAADNDSARHAPYNSKSLITKQEEEDIYSGPPVFESEIVRNKIPKYIRTKILAEVHDLHTFSSDAIIRTFKKAMLRQRYGSGLYNFAKWFASTLTNEQFYLEQQAIRRAI